MLRHALLLSQLLLLAACLSEEPPEGSAAEGALFFADNCAGCHAIEARGGGLAAVGLDPPPADLTHIAARNDGVFPDNWVMTTISGYHRDVRPGSAMPAFDVDVDVIGPTIIVEQTEGIGTPTPVTLVGLARYLESSQE